MLLPQLCRGALAAGALLIATSAHAAFDHQWNFDTLGGIDFVLTSVSTKDLFPGELPANDPTITLMLGTRYRITNADASEHPLQIIAKGANSAQDTVLLSQNTAGTLEADGAINWVEVNATQVEFTFTQTLANVFTQQGKTLGYRCGNHPSTMRGNFALFLDEASANPDVVAANLTSQHWEPLAIPSVFNAPAFSNNAGLGMAVESGDAVAFGWWQTKKALNPLPAGRHLLQAEFSIGAIAQGTTQPDVRVRVFSADNSFTAMAVMAQAGGQNLRNLVEVVFSSDGTTPFYIAVDLIAAAETADSTIVVTSLDFKPLD